MKEVILIPDSFKGTLSSARICEILAEEIHRYYPAAKVISVPVADGGEGSVDAFLAAVGGKKVYHTVKGPYFEEMECYYGILADGTAIIEMAACAGLPLVEDNKDPGKTTTYGVGELIRHAILGGAKELVIGLGGSATNDMGTGAAAAIGVKFLNEAGVSFIPTGDTLDEIYDVDMSEAKALLSGISIVTMCDINNPLYGINGAAHIFGPQKGADEQMVLDLDRKVKVAADRLEEKLELAFSHIPGAGAAGGMGAGMVAFFGAELKMGIQVVLDTVHFDSLLDTADLVITGEGKVDAQTLSGKVVVGVAERVKPKGIPVLVISGGLPFEDEDIYDKGVTAMFSINRNAEDFSVSRFKSEENLAKTMDSILRLYKAYGL